MQTIASVNRATIVGNLGSDPDVRTTDSGTAVANFSIATTDSWTDKNGERQERTEWHRIVAWARLAEICGQYLRKGKQVYIEGRLQTREWEKDGVKRYTTEIVAREMQMLATRADAQRDGAADMPAAPKPSDDENLPF